MKYRNNPVKLAARTVAASHLDRAPKPKVPATAPTA
jgi:hypothetical protein